jgi:hypothetical protein
MTAALGLCVDDPLAHDCDPGNHQGWLPNAVAEAKRICGDCPVFDACERMLFDVDTDPARPPLYGVIAGRYRPWPDHAVKAAPHGTRAAWNGHRRRCEEPCPVCAALGPPQRRVAS